MQRHLYRAPDGKDFIYLGYPMHLTPTEFCILDYIAEHRGASADALLTHCYKGKVPKQTNVSVRISAINQKAYTIGGRRLVYLVYGHGYRICDDI